MATTSPVQLRGLRRALWPVVRVRQIWTSAVADEDAVRFNLRLLIILTAIFSLPDLAQGLWILLVAPAVGARGFGAYIAALGALELGGAVLLARRSAAGRRLVMLAAAGFYLEAALGLAGFERSLLAAAVFAACAPANAWVIWFLSHGHVRAYIEQHHTPDA
jgi:hypothetical protein